MDTNLRELIESFVLFTKEKMVNMETEFAKLPQTEEEIDKNGISKEVFAKALTLSGKAEAYNEVMDFVISKLKELHDKS